MRSGMTDNGRVVADRMVTWHRPVTAAEAGRVCAEQGCRTKLSIYNSSDRCASHHRFVTIVPRATPPIAASS